MVYEDKDIEQAARGEDRLLRLTILTLLAALLPFGVLAEARANCADLPTPVREVLAAEPGWELVQLRHFYQEEEEFWQEFYGRTCPGYAAADIDGSGKPSYAVSLINQSGAVEQHKLLVLRPEGAGFTKIELPPAQRKNIAMFVIKQAPGKYVDWDSGKAVEVATESFLLGAFASATIMHYFADGTFHHLLITR